jgi:flagellar protein FliL
MFKNKKLLAGGGVFLLAAFWFYIKPNYMDAKPAPAYTEAQIAAAPRPTLKLKEQVFNLKAPATSPTYVKMQIAIEFEDHAHTFIKLKGEKLVKANEHFEVEMEAEVPALLDIVTSILGSKSIEEVATVDGREELKAELLAEFNKELKPEKVERVLFITFITQ